MLLTVKKDYDGISKAVAELVAKQIKEKPDAVIGFTSGSTPLGLYKELIRMHNDEGLSFANIISFNLDEYIGLPAEHNQSYHYFMWENLFRHIDIVPEKVHIPDGMAANIEEYCEWYDNEIEKLGGLELQILGIGGNGHIAFNEPGSSPTSRTRIKTLTEETIKDNARFFDSIDEVPTKVITMGVGTIMDSRSLVLLASGKEKAEAIKATVEGPITAMVPATIVQLHPKTFIYADEDAASLVKVIPS